MILANLREFARTGTQAGRTTTFVAFFADEEAGGTQGATGSSTTTPTGSRGAPRRSARSAATASPCRPRRASARLPAADRGEGPHLAAAPRPRPRRPRVGAQRRERDRAARRGHRPHRAHEWPREYIASVSQLLDGSAGSPAGGRMPPTTRAAARHLGRGAGFRGRDAAGHGQRDDARAWLQAQRHPADGDGRRRLPLPAGARGRRCWRPSGSSRASTSRSRSSTATSRSRRRSTATSSRR